MLSYPEAGSTGSPQVTEVIASKILLSISVCSSFLHVENNVSEGFRALGKLTSDAHFKSQQLVPTMTCQNGEMPGLLRSWEAFMDLLSTLTKVSAHITEVINTKVVQPVTGAIHTLQQVRTSLNLDSVPSSPLNAVSPPKENRDILRSLEKKELAEEELKASEESRKALVKRFGNSIKQALKDRLDERVTKAKMLVKNAQEDHKKLAKGSTPMTPVAKRSSGDMERLSPGDLAQIENAERKRLSAIREALRVSSRAFFEFQRVMNKKVASIITQVDSFDPAEDTQMWLANVMNIPFEEVGYKRRTAEPTILTQQEFSQLGHGTEPTTESRQPGGRASDVENLERELNDRERRLATANSDVQELKKQLEVLRSKNTSLQNENSRLKAENSSLIGGTNVNSGGASSTAGKRSSTDSAGGKRNSTDSAEIDSMPAKRNLSEKVGFGNLKKRLSIDSGTSKQRISVDDFEVSSDAERTSTDLSKSPPEHQVAPEELLLPIPQSIDNDKSNYALESPTFGQFSFRSNDATQGGGRGELQGELTKDVANNVEEAERQEGQVQRFSPDLEEFPIEIASHLPNLRKCLEQPMNNYITPQERLFEIQKRYEDFLLSLKNLDLSIELQQKCDWDSPSFFKGYALEYGFACYPFKIPGGMPLDTNKDGKSPPFALEWGTRRIDDFQWKCIAYETLLLCYEHVNSIMTIHQLMELPSRDIRLIDADAYTLARSTMTSVRSSRTRKSGHRRGANDLKQQMASTFSLNNLHLLRKLVSITRVKLGIAGKQNRTILKLTLAGGCNEGGFGTWTGIHPLDVRYRVIRLLDSWDLTDTPGEYGDRLGMELVFKQWVQRQIHVVYCAVAFRVARLQKFLPKHSYDWMHDVNISPASTSGRFARFTPEMVSYTKGKASKLLTCAEEAFNIITGLTRAIDQDRWGDDFEAPQKIFVDIFRNKLGIMRLFQVMTSMDTLDRSLSSQLQKTLDGETFNEAYDLSNKRGAQSSMQRKDLASMRPEEYSDTTQILATLSNDEQLILAWPYEVPFLQLILTFLWKSCCDSSASSILSIDARPLAQGVIMTAMQLQVPQDHTRLRGPRRLPLVSSQTHSLMLAHAIWNEAVNASRKGLLEFKSDTNDEFEEDFIINKPKNLNIIIVSTVKTIRMILEHLSDWLSGDIDELPTDNLTNLFASNAPSIDSMIMIRAERLKNLLPPNLKACLGLPYENPTHVAEALAIPFDPVAPVQIGIEDFSVADLRSLTFDEQCDSDRRDSGLKKVSPRWWFSLTLPSRIERVMAELLYRRLICSQFLTSVCGILEDYRLHVEAEALPELLHCWYTLKDLMLIDPPEQISAPSFGDEFEVDPDAPPLPGVLKGPTSRHDMYRYFIVRTCRNLYLRVFKETLLALKPTKPQQSKDSKDVVEVLKMFSDSMLEYIEEIRCELLFYTDKWAPFLPDAQHAAIVLYVARQDLAECLSILINSDCWTIEDMPPGGSSVLAAIKTYEVLENAVRQIVRLPVAYKPSLFEPFASSVTNALTKRFASVEEILGRCLRTETWQALDPPSVAYSLTIVDYFMFVEHVFDAVNSLFAPMEWVFPSFLKFIGRISQDFTTFVASSAMRTELEVISERADMIFNNLHNPITRSGDVHFGLLDVKKEDTKTKRTGGGLLKGFRFGAKKKKENEKNSSVTTESDPGTLGVYTASESAKGVPPMATAPSKKMKLKKTKLTVDDELTAEQIEMARRFGHDLTRMLKNTAAAFDEVPLLESLVRINNITFFERELPKLGERFTTMLRTAALDNTDPRGEEIQDAIVAASDDKRAKRRAEKMQNADRAAVETSVSRIKDVLKEVFNQCKNRINECSVSVYSALSLRLIYSELAADIFKDLYSPHFEGNSLKLEDIVMALKQTVDRLLNQCPPESQEVLRKLILKDLTKAWVMLITEIGYCGHVFTEEELNVLDEDMSIIKEYAEQHNISSCIEIRPADNQQPRKVGICDYINDFFVLIASKPHCLAAMGGNYQSPTAVDKTRVVVRTDSGVSKQSEVQSVEGMFNTGGQSPASVLSTPTEANKKAPKKIKKKGLAGFLRL